MSNFLYDIQDLGKGPKSPGMFIQPKALDEAGTVVGWFQSGKASGAHAFEFAAGAMKDLTPTLKGQSVASGVSDGASKRIVGYSSVPGGATHAVMWEDGTMTDLHPLLGMGNSSRAEDVNDSGVVVGTVESRPFILHLSSPAEPKPPPPTLLSEGSSATGVNSAGRVVGSSGAGTAFLYDGKVTDLGKPTGSTSAAADSINDSDHVAGLAYFPKAGPSGFQPASHAVLHTGGGWTDLGTLGEGQSSYALGINNPGDVVGVSAITGKTHAEGSGTAFLYTEGSMWDLNDLLSSPDGDGWFLQSATAINDAGMIAGYGVKSDLTGVRAFLLTPAPAIIPDPVFYPDFWPWIFIMITSESGYWFNPFTGEKKPTPPWDPQPPGRLDPTKRDVLVGLAITSLAGRISDPESRLQVELGGIRVIARAAELMKLHLEERNPTETASPQPRPALE